MPFLKIPCGRIFHERDEGCNAIARLHLIIVCAYICVYMYIFICMWVCIGAYIYIYVYIHMLATTRRGRRDLELESLCCTSKEWLAPSAVT